MLKQNPKLEILVYGILSGGLLAYGSWIILGLVLSLLGLPETWFSDLSSQTQLILVGALSVVATAYSTLEVIERKLKKAQ